MTTISITKRHFEIISNEVKGQTIDDKMYNLISAYRIYHRAQLQKAEHKRTMKEMKQHPNPRIRKIPPVELHPSKVVRE